MGNCCISCRSSLLCRWKACSRSPFFFRTHFKGSAPASCLQMNIMTPRVRSICLSRFLSVVQELSVLPPCNHVAKGFPFSFSFLICLFISLNRFANQLIGQSTCTLILLRDSTIRGNCVLSALLDYCEIFQNAVSLRFAPLILYPLFSSLVFVVLPFLTVSEGIEFAAPLIAEAEACSEKLWKAVVKVSVVSLPSSKSNQIHCDSVLLLRLKRPR